jgi:adenosylhomocysteine nucleosidase
MTRPSRFGLLAPMDHELTPLVRMLALEPVAGAPDSRHTALVEGLEFVATTTGIGMSAATGATERMLDTLDVEHVVVVGIAGGVALDAEIGDVVVPAIVVDGPTGREHRPTTIGDVEPFGRLITSDDLLVEPDAFARFEAEGVVALDMETSAVAAVCEQRGIPWSVFRSLSDRPRDGLVDEAIFELTQPDGSADVEALQRYLASDPAAADRLARLAHDMEIATNAAASAAIDACKQWGEQSSTGTR